MNFHPLNIPKRDRKKGEYIYCVRCKTNVLKTCKESGKALYTCKFSKSHRFQSRAYDPVRKKTIHLKTYPRDMRDYKEFTKKHMMNMERFENNPRPTTNERPIRPSRLQDAIRMYFDWFTDAGVPSHKQKGYSKKTVQNELNNLKTFRDALEESGHSFESLLVFDISDQHVSDVHEFLVGKYSNKTYNNKVYTIKSLFKYLVEKGYDIKNPFSEVKKLATQAVKTFIEIGDFKNLLSVVTKENGIKFEKDRGEVKRKSLYRDWLTDYYRLALLTGGRPEGLVKLKFKDVQEHFVSVYDFKVSRKKKIDQVRLVIRTQEFNELLHELKAKHSLESENYLIAPGEGNRIKIARHASKAFTHYWGLLGLGYKATCYDLKDTHITLMLRRFGTKYQGIYGAHDSFKTSLENYATESKMIEELSNKKMLG